MQAPVTPSYMRPGTASGDLYLFEESPVVDVKAGWIDSETRYPTYFYKGKGLSHDLGTISDLHGLYGIRKGIGVVAEGGDLIYFAVYVPWRRWRTDGPLLFLKSFKLPLLACMNRVGERGVEPHAASVNHGGLEVSVDTYVVGARVSCSDINVEALTRRGESAEMKCERVE